MKNLLLPLLLIGAIMIPVRAADVNLTLRPEQELNRIDENIYSHFLEHIYNSVNGGLWGELVWNRSFEDNDGGGWSLENNVITQKSTGDDQRFVFGNADWTDYEFTLEAQKTGGAEGFLILFRVQSDRVFSWANLGGWQNVRHGIERRAANQNRQSGVGNQPNGSIETGKWYSIRVRCEGNNVKVFLDGQQILDVTDPQMARAGQVGIGTWSTQAQFRNLKVTSLDGQNVLLGETPELAPQPKVTADGQIMINEMDELEPQLKLNVRHWETSGRGLHITVNTTDGFNGKSCIQITKDSADIVPGMRLIGGIQQKGLFLRKGEAYIVSLYCKVLDSSEMPFRLDISFMEREVGGTGVTHSWEVATNEWEKLTFEFRDIFFQEDIENAILRITAYPEKCTVLIDQVSVMSKSWAENGGFRPDLVQAIADLRPPTIRYPGGCFASAYRY